MYSIVQNSPKFPPIRNDLGQENLIMKKDDDNITLHQETKNIDKKRNYWKKKQYKNFYRRR